MTIQYHGIGLELPASRVALTHSIALDMIQGASSTQNMDWTDVLGNLPWGVLKGPCTQAYEKASRLHSLLHLDYQVCNGGISQYFYNRYDEARAPYSEHDVELCDIDVQKGDFQRLVQFAREIFPQRQEENEALARAADAFEQLSIERDAEVPEMVYCDEEEYLWDDELQKEIPNPNYYEPYEDTTYEDVIRGEEGFDDIFYRCNAYMEELLELSAQYHCKVLAKEFGALEKEHPEIAEVLRDHLPAAAFGDTTLSLKIASAQARTTAEMPEQSGTVKEPEL